MKETKMILNLHRENHRCIHLFKLSRDNIKDGPLIL